MSVKAERAISIRDVVEPEELKFVQTFLAFGEKEAAEAYRRAFMRRRPNKRTEWIEAPKGDGIPLEQLADEGQYPAYTAKEISKKANALLRQEHLQLVLAELKKNTDDLARQVLRDQALFGRPQDRVKASERIFSEIDRLGFREAVERHFEILCQISADVVVPLGTIEKTVSCPSCAHTHTVSVDMKLEIPMERFQKD